MNNEPVAWMDGEGGFYHNDDYEVCKEHNIADDLIPLYTHPVKELHLSLQKSKQTGELLAVTYTDDEHRIVEVLWQRPPVKELPTKEDEYWLMVEMLRAKVKEQQAEILAGKIMIKGYGKTIDEQQAEIEALGDMLIEEGIGVCQKYIDERIEKLRKAQEK